MVIDIPAEDGNIYNFFTVQRVEQAIEDREKRVKDQGGVRKNAKDRSRKAKMGTKEGGVPKSGSG